MPTVSFDPLSSPSYTLGSGKESRSGSLAVFRPASKQNVFEAFAEPSIIRAEGAAQLSEASRV